MIRGQLGQLRIHTTIRSEHIDIKYHFIQSEIQAGTIKLEYVPAEDNVADIFTKPATTATLEKLKPFIMGK